MYNIIQRKKLVRILMVIVDLIKKQDDGWKVPFGVKCLKT